MSQLPISRTEFIALCAMMFATIAFSIDAMLPALPEIGRELSPDNLNRAQLIITSFVLGMGIGTLFAGPLADAFGRKPVLIAGALLYSVCAFLGWQSDSLELVLAARLFQGIGAAGPRVVTLAIIRDLFAGREMAKIVSFVMMVFTLVPAIAPTLGAGIIALSSWRGIFFAFIIFSTISILWLGLRLPEPLAREDRRPLRLALLWSGLIEMMRLPVVRASVIIQCFSFAVLFATISSVQQIYDITFGRGDEFPYWFGAIALLSGSAGFINARVVMRLGMRYIVTFALGAQVLLSSMMILADMTLPVGTLLFAVFLVWKTSIFFQVGLSLGNLNAMAMEPLGHMAGTAASVMGAIATVCGAVLAVPIGLAFNGTPLPLAMGVCAFSIAGFSVILWLRRAEEHGT
ncbi:multidrug effflux MFS transporter [Shimia aestuarii]|uniref:multidrug effflux MFS transporter n=1 Tax=Shimia aestuarii TaxID=254406 RepID=UPI001FB44023|nr:multidrug effflux MFS transporter [Shimia aestuarii]